MMSKGYQTKIEVDEVFSGDVGTATITVRNGNGSLISFDSATVSGALLLVDSNAEEPTQLAELSARELCDLPGRYLAEFDTSVVDVAGATFPITLMVRFELPTADGIVTAQKNFLMNDPNSVAA